MVQFVAPGFLGELGDFKRAYSDPIMRGQGADSSKAVREKVCVFDHSSAVYCVLYVVCCLLSESWLECPSVFMQSSDLTAWLKSFILLDFTSFSSIPFRCFCFVSLCLRLLH